MSEKLKKTGKKMTGSAIVNAPCHELDTARIFRKYKEQISQFDGILVLACGAGVQAVREATEKKSTPVVIPCLSETQNGICTFMKSVLHVAIAY